ncbi:MAG: outer membrane beta-barrel protein [Syntrophotaleaceae bacterium]
MSSCRLISKIGRCCRRALLVMTILLVAAVPAMAAQLKLVPSLTLRQEYNDNLFFEDSDEERHWITTVYPGLDLVRKTERLQLDATARLGLRKYLDQEQLDSIDQQYRGTLQWRFGPRLALNLAGGYLRDFRTDRDLEEIGLTTAQTRRDREQAGLGVEYALTERSRLDLGWGFIRTEYEEDEEADSDSHTASIGWSYALTERMQNRLSLGYSHSEFTGSRIDNLVLSTGLSYSGSERLTWQVMAGGRYTRSRFEESVLVGFTEVVPGVFVGVFEKRDEESDDLGWVASASVNWKGEFSQAGLALQREVRLASGRTGSTEVTSLVLNGSHRLSEQFSMTFSGGYYINEADEGEFGGEGIDEQTLRLSPGLKYQWTPDLSAELSYDYTRLDDREEDTEQTRNLVFLRLTYRFPVEF